MNLCRGIFIPVAVIFTSIFPPVLAADLNDLLPPAAAPAAAKIPLAESKEKPDRVRAAEEKVRGIAPRLSQGSELEKAAARTEARKALGELFDAKLAIQEEELALHEKKAAELKVKIARKKAGREKAVDERLAKMGGEDDWE